MLLLCALCLSVTGFKPRSKVRIPEICPDSGVSNASEDSLRDRWRRCAAPGGSRSVASPSVRRCRTTLPAMSDQWHGSDWRSATRPVGRKPAATAAGGPQTRPVRMPADGVHRPSVYTLGQTEVQRLDAAQAAHQEIDGVRRAAVQASRISTRRHGPVHGHTSSSVPLKPRRARTSDCMSASVAMLKPNRSLMAAGNDPWHPLCLAEGHGRSPSRKASRLVA